MNINLVFPNQIHRTKNGNIYFELQDKESPLMIWVIKRTPCYHYYVNKIIKMNDKVIGNDTFHKKFVKVSVKGLKQLDGIDFTKYLKRIKK